MPPDLTAHPKVQIWLLNGHCLFADYRQSLFIAAQLCRSTGLMHFAIYLSQVSFESLEGVRSSLTCLFCVVCFWNFVVISIFFPSLFYDSKETVQFVFRLFSGSSSQEKKPVVICSGS